jgi:hypothetical protein
MPETVTEVGGLAFCDCPNLSTVILSSNLSTISYEMFINCTSLKEIEIPQSVKTIQRDAFNGTGFEKVVIPSHVENIDNSVFANCLNLYEVEFTQGVKQVGSYMFENCTKLYRVILPKSVERIGSYAFHKCESLEDINVESVHDIWTAAFRNCTKIKSINLPNIKTLYQEAFYGCTGLVTVTLGKYMSAFDSSERFVRKGYVFYGCKNLEDFYCYAETVPKAFGEEFTDAYIEYATLHVPASAIETYRSTKPWSDFGTIVAIESTGLEEIDNGKLAMDNSSPLYNLQGQQVSHPVKGQIYIKAGKKVVVR